MRLRLILPALALAGLLAYAATSLSDGSADANAPAAIEVTRGTMESVVTAQGTLEPKDSVEVGAQISGKIVAMHKEVGDQVVKGDLIAEIDADIYEANVLASRASLKDLRAQQVEQKALIVQAKQKLTRNTLLYKDKAVSKEVLEDAQTDLDVARARLEALDARIEEAESSLKADETNLGYTKIFAPMDGTIVTQAVEEGQTINAMQTTPTIVSVANLDVMTVRAQVAEADIMKLTPGMPVYFTTLGSQDRRWQGDVRQILPSPETINDVILYNVLVDVSNEDRQLMTGMTTQLFFQLAIAGDMPMIPLSALGRRLPEEDTAEGEAYEVMVAASGGKPQPRTVIVHLQDRSNAAIASGLDAGEYVLAADAAAGTSFERRLPPGMRGL